ncbi:TIGR03089 family protein [Nocardioides zeae]|uniref:TIGR03089 family protein n=1 Tax=Nocardioides imazamoxiresistens TaxID=3231893 RepID=A0ABU3PTX0_9ACTN|nr:TIGR03089 family protein [Nocardioides zeae]MDT9592689.1 TIGR03089 family protein [Nocardioides zeae]
MLPAARTLPDRIAALVRADPGRPLVTYYGHDTDGAVVERTELSTTTWANWAAKLAGLLTDELEVERGDRLAVDLPTHWMLPVAWGAAWSAGIEVVAPDAPGAPAAVLCGPRSLDRWAPLADDLVVVAAALTPLARPFGGGVPAGVHDLGVEVWSQPDGYVPLDPPEPEDAALAGASHTDLLASARAAGSDERRLHTGLGDPDAARAAVAALLGGGSLVLVDDDAPPAPWWGERRAVIERDERVSRAG